MTAPCGIIRQQEQSNYLTRTSTYREMTILRIARLCTVINLASSAGPLRRVEIREWGAAPSNLKEGRMSACILPFPRSSDQHYIERHAHRIVNASSAEKADAHLRRQLAIQYETMRRRGIAHQAITDELTSIERSIREVVHREMLQTGGVA